MIARSCTPCASRSEAAEWRRSWNRAKKWWRCPECASSNICWIQTQDDDLIEAGSIETAIEVAGEMLDELKSKLPDLADSSAETRSECMRLVFEIAMVLSRGAELEREREKGDDELKELVREFGLDEGSRRWCNALREDETPAPAPVVKVK
jgi:hypothetical protein